MLTAKHEADMSLAEIFSYIWNYPITGWTILWFILGALGLFIVLVIVLAVDMHFSLKRHLKASGVVFAERKKKVPNAPRA
jgi:hypothetical protein